MTVSHLGFTRDGRFTILLLLLFGLLLCDFSRSRGFAFSERDKDAGSCRQLHYVQPNSLVVENCLAPDVKHGEADVPARFRPFLFAPIPINTAEKDMLMTVDGIGPALADEIMRYRRQFGSFTSNMELLNLPGIGPKRAAKFAKAFSFSEEL